MTKIRLEVRSQRDTIAEVREESAWPLERTVWTPLYLAPRGELSTLAPSVKGHLTFQARSEGARFSWRVPQNVELTGPMAAHLWIELEDSTDVDLFVGVELWRNGRYVTFEGSYGYGRDRVTTGWLKASLRELDEVRSKAWAPVHTFMRSQSLQPGEIAAMDIALNPSATLFLKGDELRLVAAGRYLSPTGLLTGQFPAAYPGQPKGRCTLHWSPEQPGHLLVPVMPALMKKEPQR